jgi:hypothetical protein
MFAREVTVHLKPNTQAIFTQTLEKEIIPLLRKVNGFQDEITFLNHEGTEAVGISLWDRKENADTYNTGTYPQVLKSLDRMVEGKPRIRTYEVSNSTWHKIAVQKPV